MEVSGGALSGDEISSMCHMVEAQYRKYGRRGKPTEREWTHLATVFARIEGRLVLLCLATGTKCLPATAVHNKGFTVNDSHAEVLARRCFLSYLYSEMLRLMSGGKKCFLLSFNCESKLFHIKHGIEFFMYTSHTPCGDGSISPAESGSVHAPPSKKLKSHSDMHRTGAKCTPSGPQDPLESGSDYHVLGAFRTKPGRGEKTLSMSCSDKMCKWTQLGIQGSLLMTLLESPIYFSAIVFARCPFCEESVKRAVIERNRSFKSPVKLYVLQEPELFLSQSKCPASPGPDETPERSPSHLSLLWHSHMEKPQVLVDGYRQGATAKNINSPLSRSVVSRWNLYRDFCEVLKLVDSTRTRRYDTFDVGTSYLSAKQCAKGYMDTWKALKDHYKHWINDSRKEKAQGFVL